MEVDLAVRALDDEIGDGGGVRGPVVLLGQDHDADLGLTFDVEYGNTKSMPCGNGPAPLKVYAEPTTV